MAVVGAVLVNCLRQRRESLTAQPRAAKEIAIVFRSATRPQLIRQLLIESFLLPPSADWSDRCSPLGQYAPGVHDAAGPEPDCPDLHPNLNVLAFNTALCLLTDCCSGSPRPSGRHVDLTPALKQSAASLVPGASVCV